jgi:hypothetical protein
MTSPTDEKRLEELIVDAKAIVADGDAYGTKAQHPTTIHTRQIIEKLADALTSIKAERDRLREALKPFAKMADQMPASKTWIAWGYDFTAITFEDFRKAASLIKEGDSRS